MTPRATSLLVAATLAAVGALAAAPPASGFVLVTTADGTPIHWRDRCVELWTHTALFDGLEVDDAVAAYAAAAATWTDVECTWLDLAVRGFTCFDDVGLADWPGTQNVLSWPEGPGSWPHADRVVALTSITFDKRTGEIVDADIELNGEDYAFGADGERDRYDLQQTLTHELGHVLGLDHSLQRPATMYALSYVGETAKRDLTDDDVAGLCTSHPSEAAPAGGACQNVPLRAVDDPWCPAAPDDGCAAGGGGAAWLTLLGLALVALPRRRRRPDARPPPGVSRRRPCAT